MIQTCNSVYQLQIKLSIFPLVMVPLSQLQQPPYTSPLHQQQNQHQLLQKKNMRSQWKYFLFCQLLVIILNIHTYISVRIFQISLFLAFPFVSTLYYITIATMYLFLLFYLSRTVYICDLFPDQTSFSLPARKCCCRFLRYTVCQQQASQ